MYKRLELHNHTNESDAVFTFKELTDFMVADHVDAFALTTAEGAAKMATFRPLGYGNVSFPAVKAALEEVGYDGVLCVELDNPVISNYHSAEVSRTYLRDVLGL